MNRAPQERAASVAAGNSTSIPLRVLILEDDRQDAELCIQELDKAGFQPQVDVVDTEQAFVARLQSQVYDIILADHQIPAWSGVEALRLLERSGEDVPFIFVAGTLGEEAAVDLVKEGATDYVRKDRLARLPSAVQRALEEKITRDERESAIQALRESEEMVRLLLNSTAEAICGVDLRGNCTFSNSACVRTLGYDSPEELLGKQMHLLTHHTRADGTLYPAKECAIHKAIREGKATHADNDVFWRKDGSSFPADHRSYPMLRNGETIGAVVIFIDVTERKRAEEALQRSETRVRRLVESNIIGISTGDLNGKLIEANDAFLGLLGYTREDLLSGQLRWDALTPPEYRDTDQLAIDRLRSTGVAPPWEKQFIRKDGSRVSVLIGVVTLQAESAKTEAISFVVDISERKLLEQQLRQSQKMEAIGRLAGGIAHDFNNLLGVIIGYSEILEERLGQDHPLRPKAEQIKKAGHRAARLTRQLLAFSRQQVLEPKILDLNALVADTLNMLQRLIGDDIELVTVLGPELGRVEADQGQIEQVILNLALNARDAMTQGGRLTIRTFDAEVDDVGARQHPEAVPGPYVRLSMSDTGCGMDQETRAHIFEPFFTTKELGKGTGLGLSTVYGVVKQSGGFMSVYSELGRGTSFEIYLPRVDGSVKASASEHDGKEISRGRETILLVEDAQALRELTHELLEASGYTVLEAANGTSAIRMAEKHREPIHLLLSDVVMPGMNGRELAEFMVRIHPEINVLYMSGYTDDSVVHRGVLDSGIALLQKPFTKESLTCKVREVLLVKKDHVQGITVGRLPGEKTQ
jgi:two-component system, cell cycle sensor histidine kinase and response regulator CckA